MPKSATIKPTHKAIQQYYQALQDYRDQNVKHEGAVETAFQRLLSDTARQHDCTLIPKQKLRVGKTNIFPDGTVRDMYQPRRGFWEAKDTDDDLDREISSKIAKGYPLTNTIFEDTRRAVLFQGGRERYRFDLTDKKQLTALLNEFYAYAEPEIENFHEAVREFQERVPELARGLVEKLNEAHKSNKKFQAAFESFFTVCQQTLNPNISRAAVDEMLVQHLLTERLIRKVFDNPEFTRRNVIAAEIEKVIDALVSLSFKRDDFLKSLDRFYRAIEDAAHTMPEFNDKQHFLNTVYERFFQGYSVKVADTHGIVYTPQEIVDFMCASVEEVLQTEFGLTLGSPGVNILDPCTGTGNFIVNLIGRIPKKDLPRVYREQLFANEVMLLPYYIAALNIEHAYWEKTGQYEAFDGLCFVDTLELAEKAQRTFSFMTAANTARIERQKRTSITLIIGNPPYNANQINENDNNKNRQYDSLDDRIKTSYARDSTATLKNKLYDPYVRFFRWATDRLANTDGIVCFVTNNSFIESGAFDGLRKHFFKDFSKMFIFDLRGDIRRDSMRDGIPLGEKHTVFGLSAMVGVSIAVLVRTNSTGGHELYFSDVNFRSTRIEKFTVLKDAKSVAGIKWKRVEPDSSQTWIQSENDLGFRSFTALGAKSRETIFKQFSTGAKSNRDPVVYNFNSSELATRVEQFVENYNGEVDRYKRIGTGKDPDVFVDNSKVSWSSTLKLHLARGRYADFEPKRIRVCLYRPFTTKHLYYDEILNDRPGLFRYVLPSASNEEENRVICCTCHSQLAFIVQVTNRIANEAVGGRAGTCFPFHVYDEDGSNRRENITDWALEQFRTRYGDEEARRASRRKPDVGDASEGGDAKTRRAYAATLAEGERDISKWDIFYYVYGLLHHPGYRTKFADNLKRELPRIPFAPALSPLSPVLRGEGSGVRGDSTLQTPHPQPLSPEYRGEGGTASGFWPFADAGKELARLHLDYEKLEPWPLQFQYTEGVPLSYRVEDKMRLTKDKSALRVNPSLTLAGIPPEVSQYRLGNRSALDWVIDQYQLSEDPRSGIRSDPNRADDEEYIVRLVGQVIRVSLETVRIVNALPERYAE